jgi:hypothetical protein
MNEKEDVGFTFDPKPFLNGLNQVTGGLQRLEKGIGKAFTGAALKVAGIGLAIKGALFTITKYMPELNKVFDISRDIFFKNFLWPLRQTLAPYLQKILDWFRDHRGEFVKWGTVLVTVFKTGAILAKALWNALKSVVGLIQPLIRSVFKGGLSDFVNLILTKVALVVEWISQGLAKIIEYAKGPFYEIVGYVSDIAKKLWEIVHSVIDFGKNLLFAKINGASLAESIGKLVGAIGRLAGTEIKKALEFIQSFLNGLASSELSRAGGALSAVADALTTLVDAVNKIMGNEDMKGFATWLGKTFGDAAQLTLTTFGAAAIAVAKTLGNMMYSFQIMKAQLAGKDTSGLKAQLDTFNSDIDKSMSRISALGNAATDALGKDVRAIFGISTIEGMSPEEKTARARSAESTLPPTMIGVGIGSIKPNYEKQPEGQRKNVSWGDYGSFARRAGMPPQSSNRPVVVGDVHIQIGSNVKSLNSTLDDLTGAFRNKVYGAMVAQGYR